MFVKDFINKYDRLTYIKTIYNKKVNFKTNKCELFPKFDVTGTVISNSVNNSNEVLTKLKVENKVITVGSNMTGLEFILKE